MQDDILVSCTVVSYNSAETVIETLESIKAQTYQNIELIVSDDCSTDNTVELCREWIAANKERFVRAVLLTVEKNTGVAGNDNRAIAACKGEWKKGIAADDKLLPNCVNDFVNFVHDNPEARWIASNVLAYRNTFEPENLVSGKFETIRSFYALRVEDQLKRMAAWNRINAPSLFFNVSFLNEIGGYGTEYSFEDYPFFVKALEHGFKCYYMDKDTVCYRIHDSMSQSKGRLFNYEFMKESRRFHREKLFKYLTQKQIKGQNIIWKLQDWLVRHNLNKNDRIISFVYYKTFALINRIYDL